MSRRTPKPPGTKSENPKRAPRRPKFTKTRAGGGGIFSHDPSKLADALPEPDEGDALLDQLFEEGASEARPSGPLAGHPAGAGEPSDEGPETSAGRATLHRVKDPVPAAPQGEVAGVEPTPSLGPDSESQRLSLPVEALPPDRGSTEELELDDLEVLSSAHGAWQSDAFEARGALSPSHHEPTDSERPTRLAGTELPESELPESESPESQSPESQSPESERPTRFAGSETPDSARPTAVAAEEEDGLDGAPTLFPPAGGAVGQPMPSGVPMAIPALPPVPRLEPDDDQPEELSLRDLDRSPFEVLSVVSSAPPLPRRPTGPAPMVRGTEEPAPSHEVPTTRLSDAGIDVVIDEGFGDPAPLPTPSSLGEEPLVVGDFEFLDIPDPPVSREALEAAEESVADWLASAEPSSPPGDADVLALSLDDEDSPDGLPIPPPRGPLPSTEIFVEGEQAFEAAVVTLVERGERQAWLDRADRLRAAAPRANAAARASALLVVSELYAIAGELGEAEKVALEALQLAPNSPMHQRQLRGLVSTRRAWEVVFEQLGRESRSGPTPTARAHAAFVAAEVARLKLRDADAVARMLERGSSADPSDVRGALGRWAAGVPGKESPLEVPEGPAQAVFASAEVELSALRTNGVDGAEPASRHGRLLRARAGLRRRDAAAAVTLCQEFATTAGLGGAASWLAVVLGAPHPEHRAQVGAALEAARAGTHPAMAARRAVAHALETGDRVAMVAAVQDGLGLRASERLLLAALSGEDPEAPLVVESLGRAEDGSSSELPLWSGAAAALGAGLATGATAGEEPGRIATLLGRQLAAAAAVEDRAEADMLVAPLAEAALGLASDDGVARAFTLERSGGRVALATVDGGSGEVRALASALLAELAGDRDAMRAELAAVPPGHPVAARMRAAIGTPLEAAALLEALATHESDPVAAVLLGEAACRVATDPTRAESLWRAAHERDEHAPAPPLFAFTAALAAGDVDTARLWLGRCRLEPLHERILEALRLAEPGSEGQLAALADAHRMRPDDPGLRALYERAGGSRVDRAAWLAERAQGEAGTLPASTYAIEAAWLFEFDDDPAAAVHVLREHADTPLAEVALRRLALRGHGTERVAVRLEAALARSEDGRARAAWLADLARVGWSAGDRRGASLRYAELAGLDAAELTALYEASVRLADGGQVAESAGVALALARRASGPEASAHATLALHGALRRGDLASASVAARVAQESSRHDAWAIRNRAEIARRRRDDDALWRASCDLAERTSRPLDQAVLLCRAAEAALATGDAASAEALCREACQRWPRHPMPRLVRAAILERAERFVEAAQAHEELAGMSRSRRDRARRYFKAATLWLGSHEARAELEGRRLLEATCDLDPEHGEAFERLQALYLASGARMELADLLSQRSRATSDPDARGALEVLRGRMLAEAGASAEAKAALAASVKARPEDVGAWRAYAEVAFAEQDGEAAEQALLQLGRLLKEPRERFDVYLRLGDVYARLRPNLERARRAYREAEKLDGARVEVRERLIELQAAAGDPGGAFAAQRALCEEASTPHDAALRTLGLAGLHERHGDLAEAERVLVDLRRHQPTEVEALRGLHDFYLRQERGPQASALLERIPYEVARLLSAGRIDPSVFEVAIAAAELRRRPDGLAVAQAVARVARGEATRLSGAGATAGHAALDAQLAPEVFGADLRELLLATGHLLDAASPFDGVALRTRPLAHHDDLVARARALAAGYGVAHLELVVANTLPATVVPVSSSPVVLCVGAPLLEPSRAELLEVGLHRALALVRTRTTGLARTAPIDQGPLLAAYLRLHAPDLAPVGVDPARLAEFERRLHAALGGARLDASLADRARRVFDGIGSRTAGLGAAAVGWSWRVAALASGDLGLVVEAIAFSVGAGGLPAAGDERLRWLGKHLEARDLLAFLVTDAHVEARRRLALAPT